LSNNSRSNNKNIGGKLSKRDYFDNPYARHDAAIIDLAADGKPISKLRLTALEQARQMPVSDNGSIGPQTPVYIFSQLPVPKGSNWVQMGPTAIPHGQTHSSKSNALVTGRVTAIVVDPTDPNNIIYLGTAQGGIWKTLDGGRNWVAKSDYAASLSIGTLVMDPKNPSILYAGTGEGNIAREIIGGHHPESYYGCGILKTTDGGQTWLLLGGEDNPFIGTSFFRLAINPKNSSIIFAATSAGLYRSSNGGEDWSPIKIDLKENTQPVIAASDIVINPLNPDIAYVAFWANGIYKTTTANADNPSWTKLEGAQEEKEKLPTNGFNRIALGMSYSSPDILYVLMSNNSGVIDKFYCTTDGGRSWEKIKLPGMVYDKPYLDSIGPQGSYNINVAVDPSTPDIVYLSGVSVWKAIHNIIGNTWEIKNIGQHIHADNHAFDFNPSNPFVIYTGNDGGIYKSTNGGETWIDVINEGLCTTQFEFMDQHPESDAIVLSGTQDNGTLQFRNNPSFYFSAYGDGGFTAIDPRAPNIIIRQYTNTALSRSEEGGKIDSWKSIEYGLEETEGRPTPCLFYAPFTLDQEDSRHIAFGADKLFIDMNQGLYGWRKPDGSKYTVELSRSSTESQQQGLISAINYVNSNLIYVGTTKGKAYRLVRSADGYWNPIPIHNGVLPEYYIWDLTTMPSNPHTVIVVMAGYGSQEKPISHIWRGTISENDDKTEWEDISGQGIGRLPDTPINSIVIDPKPPHVIYVGTDIGIFRTSKTNDKTWLRFSQGLPNCAVYDMRLNTSMSNRLLRIVTHGRGMWERDLDAESIPDVNIFVRDHLMDTGRFIPSLDGVTSAFEDPFQNEYPHLSVLLGSKLSWDMCADIKVDTPRGDPPTYQMDMEKVDYVKFESQLYHCNATQGSVSHVYVQIHNRGIKTAEGQVSIKLLYANAILDQKGNIEYPDLPQDFWTAFPHNSLDTSNWKPIGNSQTLPKGQKTLTNTEPTVVSWQWNVPTQWNASSAIYSIVGLLVIIESTEDSIPKDNKIFNLKQLVMKERRVGLRSVYIIKPE
jgi:photosystem II stability/assembly factor-like uncharacterized protein